MKLLHAPSSLDSCKARAALLHRGDPCSAQVLDRPEVSTSLNPFGRPPVLETEDGAIYESTTIVEYLEVRGPRTLLPPGMERFARHFDRLGDRYLIASMDRLRAGVAPDDARAWITTAWQVLDAWLAERPFLAGRHFSLGDIGPALATEALRTLGEHPPSRVISWRDRCFDLPAMQATLDEAWPHLSPTSEPVSTV